MKRIRVKFIDLCAGWQPEEDSLFRLLCDRYDVELVDRDPDYVVSVCAGGWSDLKYPRAIKICVIGENVTPDFNRFDYAIGLDRMTFGDRYVRVPFYTMAPYDRVYRELVEPRHVLSDGELLGRKFCSFLVSNRNGDSFRTEFFERLSKYKRVDSGGKVLNNIGTLVPDKQAFISGYKFNIAFENSSYRGYTTEKLMEPLSANTVPIYYGDPDVEQDFNGEAMIRVRSRDDVERAVEEVIRLDHDDAAYLAKCRAPKIAYPADRYEQALRKFIHAIFDQPVEQARRTCIAAHQHRYRAKLTDMVRTRELLHAPFRVARENLKIVRRKLGLKNSGALT